MRFLFAGTGWRLRWRVCLRHFSFGNGRRLPCRRSGGGTGRRAIGCARPTGAGLHVQQHRVDITRRQLQKGILQNGSRCICLLMLEIRPPFLRRVAAKDNFLRAFQRQLLQEIRRILADTQSLAGAHVFGNFADAVRGQRDDFAGPADEQIERILADDG